MRQSTLVEATPNSCPVVKWTPERLSKLPKYLRFLWTENEEANIIPEDLITSVKEVKGEADHDWELGQLHQELPGGDTRVTVSSTGNHQEFSAPLDNNS
jgi:hypothetical protein